MNITAADIVSAILAIAAILNTIISSRKARSDAEALQAKAVNTYAAAASQMAHINQDTQARLDAMSKRVDELTKLLELRDKTINALESKVKEFTIQLDLKDKRISELERLTRDQETELVTLRKQFETLKKS
jgi:uncharacterized protein HemX